MHAKVECPRAVWSREPVCWHLQALNKKEHKGAMSPESPEPDAIEYNLTPRTEAKYTKIDEEFQLMMQRHQHNGTRVSGGRRSMLFDGRLTSRGQTGEKEEKSRPGEYVYLGRQEKLRGSLSRNDGPSVIGIVDLGHFRRTALLGIFDVCFVEFDGVEHWELVCGMIDIELVLLRLLLVEYLNSRDFFPSVEKIVIPLYFTSCHTSIKLAFAINTFEIWLAG